MKAIFHIATGNYEFGQIEYDPSTEALTSLIIKTTIDDYKKTKNAFDGKVVAENGVGMQEGPGLPKKEFNSYLDAMLGGSPLDSEEYAKMDVSQWAVLQELKKSQARLKNNKK